MNDEMSEVRNTGVVASSSEDRSPGSDVRTLSTPLHFSSPPRMQLVDTNIVAYLLIEGDRTGQAQALWQADPDWRSESFYRIEFSNLLATHVRAKALTLAQAVTLLDHAATLVPAVVDAAHADALRAAALFGVSAYDARFLVAAENLGIKLVTEDSRLHKAAPKLTRSLGEALAI